MKRHCRGSWAGGWRDPGEDGRVWAWGVGKPEFILALLLAHLAPQVSVIREGELDGRDRPGGAVHEEYARPQEGGLVWNGRDGAEISLPVGAVAPGAIQGGGEAAECNLCRVAVPPAVVATATEPIASCGHVREGL